MIWLNTLLQNETLVFKGLLLLHFIQINMRSIIFLSYNACLLQLLPNHPKEKFVISFTPHYETKFAEQYEEKEKITKAYKACFLLILAISQIFSNDLSIKHT